MFAASFFVSAEVDSLFLTLAVLLVPSKPICGVSFATFLPPAVTILSFELCFGGRTDISEVAEGTPAPSYGSIFLTLGCTVYPFLLTNSMLCFIVMFLCLTLEARSM